MQYNRPWGYYINLYENEYSNYKVKKIYVNPMSRLSLQSHSKRQEHWVIVKGSGLVFLDDKYINVHEGDYIYIETGIKHRIENNTDLELIFVETQIGSYLEEDDIIRYEDDYGR